LGFSTQVTGYDESGVEAIISEIQLPHNSSRKYHAVVSRKKLLLTASVGIVVVLCLIAWSPWNVWRYRGDAKFSDGGFFAYPRYVLTFPDMPLYETGEYRFRLQGLPSEEMTLMLYVKNSSGSMEERPRLTSLPTSIGAVLTDSHGKDVCRASGRPADSNEDGIWVLMSGGGRQTIGTGSVTTYLFTQMNHTI
jgi:hypothetical protein